MLLFEQANMLAEFDQSPLLVENLQLGSRDGAALIPFAVPRVLSGDL